VINRWGEWKYMPRSARLVATEVSKTIYLGNVVYIDEKGEFQCYGS